MGSTMGVTTKLGLGLHNLYLRSCLSLHISLRISKLKFDVTNNDGMKLLLCLINSAKKSLMKKGRYLGKSKFGPMANHHRYLCNGNVEDKPCNVIIFHKPSHRCLNIFINGLVEISFLDLTLEACVMHTMLISWSLLGWLKRRGVWETSHINKISNLFLSQVSWFCSVKSGEMGGE